MKKKKKSTFEVGLFVSQSQWFDTSKNKSMIWVY